MKAITTNTKIFDLNMFCHLAADFARIRLEASVKSHVPEFLDQNHG